MVLAVAQPVAAVADGTTERVSVTSDGSQADQGGSGAAISDDGRFVAFSSWSTDLVPGDTNDVEDVFVHDRDTGLTERVSVAGDGSQSDGGSNAVAISGDGRYVAFVSQAANLVTGDTNGALDVFVRDRVTGDTERVSVAGDGSQADGSSGGEPALSADGRYVAFDSNATNLVPGDTNGRRDVFVRDRLTGSTERVSVAQDGTQGDGISSNSSLSADGRVVAFLSSATSLVQGDTNGSTDVFVRERDTGVTERVSVASDGSQGDGGAAGAPSISDDGRLVAFGSAASNLVSGDTNEMPDSFVHDRDTGQTERVSVASDGTQGDDNMSIPARISGDGRYVGFPSYATNLIGGNGEPQVLVHDRVTGETEKASVASDGTQANGFSGVPDLSFDGRYVAFYSGATNLVPGDTNNSWDVFVRDRLDGAVADTTPPVLGLPDGLAGEATGPDGAVVTYDATAADETDLAPQVTCEPSSGSTFAIGDTTVSCTATDAAGNEATGSFVVTVAGAQEQLQTTEQVIVSYELAPFTERVLLAQLTLTERALEAERVRVACAGLTGFTGTVRVFERVDRVTSEQAGELTGRASRISAVVGC